MAGALFGAIVLSRELKRIALVKPQGCPVWCFPIGEVEGQDGTVAAISVVDKQTGVNIRGKISEDFVEAEFPAGSGTQCRLYMAYDVPDGTMQPAPESAIEQASWHPVEEIVNLPPDTSAEEQPVMPFVQGLKQWIARNHELRVKGDEKFGWNLIYAKDRWIGIKPQMVLRNHLQGNQSFPTSTKRVP
ncbi:unnamed protein product [Ostreobium quekettii]|uniref:Nudix hydrolase domain-containing protein n=1 Tax=Ostreobium quekettii TaxID=121088 RepID=A0A8S1IRY3_9CHLO|nr:unnamed protein product [Ostreobium quekettii]